MGMDNSKMREAELRLKKSQSMIFSMTKQERANPALFITDKTARSRITRITKGSGCLYDDGINFISEFQRMRTMMSRMQKQMGNGNDNDPATQMATVGADATSMPQQQQQPPLGNRAMRRAQKKKGKRG